MEVDNRRYTTLVQLFSTPEHKPYWGKYKDRPTKVALAKFLMVTPATIYNWRVHGITDFQYKRALEIFRRLKH